MNRGVCNWPNWKSETSFPCSIHRSRTLKHACCYVPYSAVFHDTYGHYPYPYSNQARFYRRILNSDYGVMVGYTTTCHVAENYISEVATYKRGHKQRKPILRTNILNYAHKYGQTRMKPVHGTWLRCSPCHTNHSPCCWVMKCQELRMKILRVKSKPQRVCRFSDGEYASPSNPCPVD